MSKEPAWPCHLGCGMMVAFPEYHLPHCKNNPNKLKKADKKHMEAVMSKGELHKIATQMPPGDQRVSRRRKRIKT